MPRVYPEDPVPMEHQMKVENYNWKAQLVMTNHLLDSFENDAHKTIDTDIAYMLTGK